MLIFYNYKMEFHNKTDYNNIPTFIEQKINRKLHNQQNHPIEIMKRRIYDYFNKLDECDFVMFDELDPIVSTIDNFDRLLIPENHPARSKSDTYYLNEKQVLRTHTSAHQSELLSKGYTQFLAVGDVYRKDEIDARHFPIFHQVEVVKLIDNDANEEVELKKLLSGLVEYLFPNHEYRYNHDYFPFTNPSYEIEVKHNDKWIEILGCGVMQNQILEDSNPSIAKHKKGIAAGFGLDRLVMIFCDIPDIRYLWSQHKRFTDQYADGKLNKFQPYSELPSQYKDLSFYIPNQEIENNININIKWSDENDFFEIIRNHIGDIVEKVELIDQYMNNKTNKYSRTYRITYSPNDPNITNPSEFTKYTNILSTELGLLLKNNLEIELR